MSFFKQTILTVPIEGETVLLRADYNVPLTKDGKIADDFRIQASLPTIKKLLDENCKVVIISHMGRPEGQDPACSLEQVGVRLSELLGQPVTFVPATIGDQVKLAVKQAPKRSVLLLENLRYFPEEEANDQAFAHAIATATGARYFVQDGFGVVHRAHASTSAITAELPSVAGLLLEKEYTTITDAMKAPKRPLVAVVGGAKVADKIGIIHKFIEKADTIFIGGAMANTFLAYHGHHMGKSKLESDQKDAIDTIYTEIRNKIGDGDVNEFLVLPSDVAVGRSLEAGEVRRVVSVNDVQDDDIALDIGDATIAHMAAIIEKAQTVIWNGTLGYAENSNFAHGSARLALTLASHPDIASIIGGGDTADFVLHWDAQKGKSFTHVSTGGGASLELMSGDKLPGIESLLDAHG